MSNQFRSAIQKIASHGDFPSMPVRYNIAKLVEMLDKEGRTAATLHHGIMQEAQVKMKGVENDNDQEAKTKKSEEIQKEVNAKMSDLLAIEATFEKRQKLTMEQIGSVPLSPIELLSIHEILEAPIEDVVEAAEQQEKKA